MDDADYAKINETRDRELALANLQNRPPQPAQQRDDDGTIVCIDCADPIAPARLAIKPDAARCTDCKQAMETSAKGFRAGARR